jgi:hypothetical protein
VELGLVEKQCLLLLPPGGEYLVFCGRHSDLLLSCVVLISE